MQQGKPDSVCYPIKYYREQKLAEKCNPYKEKENNMGKEITQIIELVNKDFKQCVPYVQEKEWA